jgi:Flp pilus assembly protein TadG
VFFLVIFALVDGGLLLYSVNAVDQAATIGSNAIAALGNADGPTNTADLTAVQRMATAGLTTTSLVKVQEIDVEELVPCSVSPYCPNDTNPDGFQVHSDGTPRIQTGCTGGPTTSDGANSCVNEYTLTGSTPNVVAAYQWKSCAAPPPNPGDPSQCPPWPPTARDITNGQSSFVGLKIKYTYSFFTGIAGTLSLTSLKTFRLEPQNNVGS